MNPALREYLAAPESVRAAFDAQLAREAEAETDFRRYMAELEDDDSASPRLPDGDLPREPVRWNERWTRRAKRRREHPQANAYDREQILALDLRETWHALTGEDVPRHGYVSCPLPDHDDRHASCQVYDSGRGWFCFVCDRGGTVVDLAAIVWEIEPTGRGFFEIRERLLEAA